MKRQRRGRRARGSKQPSSRRDIGLSFEQLEPRLAMAVVINEFLADNETGLTDFSAERHDWIELKNTGAIAEDIGGWYLTDDSTNLTKWQVPAGTSIAAGQHLVVFASSKNLTGAELHTNFGLSNNGEDLALVMPDGTTIADSYLNYPAQLNDVSYGIGASTSTTSNVTLVGASSTVKAHVPTGENAAVDDNWREIGFSDASWLSGTRSVGFDRNSDGVNLAPFIGRVLTTGEMSNTQTTAYVRYAFDVTDKDQLTSLAMELRFDDGFIMYLNGREVGRANFAEDFIRPQPQWDSFAGNQVGTGSSAGAANRVAEALDVATFDLSAYLPQLVNGTNVLAFHGVNSNSTSGSSTNRQDFFIEPVLTATRATAAAASMFMAAPTPGDDNGLGTLGFVADTNFSIDRGFYTAPIQVAVTSNTPGAQIRYTTDGSLPTATLGTLYVGPISITTTTILRAIAFKEGFTSSNVDTETYIFLDDVIGQSAADVTQPYAPWGHDKDDPDTASGYNLDDESDWEMDPDVVTGNEQAVKDALTSIPTMSLVMDWDDLFGGNPQPGTFPAGSNAAPQPQGIYIHGTSSERYASLEYMNANAATDTFHLDVGVEMQGHSSTLRWNSDKMSFQVKFKFPYGPTELNYPLFADALFGEGSTSEFDTLVFDAMFNYAWHHQNPVQRDYARFVTDQVVSDLQNLASGAGAPHGKYVHLYLNGLYWGLYNVHERPDDSFAPEYYGGNKDDYDVIKHANQDVAHEYTWVEGGVAAEGRYAALISATQAVQDNPGNAALYQTVADQLDVEQFIDYMIVHYYAGNAADWSHNNWYATRDRNGGLWRFHAWDQEHAFPTTDNGDSFTQFTDLTGKDDAEAPTAIHRNLIGNAEYKLKFADRVQALMENGGVLSPAAAEAVYQARIDEITSAIIGESARWGDNRNSTDPYTQADFLAVNNAVISDFFPVRTSEVRTQFAAAGWLQSLAAPVFNNYGGEVSPGFDVSISKPVGAPVGAEIFYTTDGSDPRLVGGAANPVATHGTGPFTVDVNVAKQVKARVKNGSEWSPLIDATFTLPGVFPVRITELNYHPADHAGILDPDELEFIELLNTGMQSVDLAGVQIAQFATNPYVFGSGIELDPGERIVVAKNPTVFQSVYGMGITLAPNGYGTSNLSNGGERVVLLGPLGETLQDFTYDDFAPWPTAPDGNGSSLEIVDPLGDPSDPTNWRASYYADGSPGSEGLPPAALPGDYDANGTVEPADYDVWKAAFGTAVTPGSGADGNANGVVDAADYSVWRNNLGATQPPGSGSLAGGGGLAAIAVPSEFAMDLQIASPAIGTATVIQEERIAVAAARVDANLLLWQLPEQNGSGERTADADSDLQAIGDARGTLDRAAVWEDDVWLRRLARGL
jgi:hypothetical protein